MLRLNYKNANKSLFGLCMAAALLLGFIAAPPCRAANSGLSPFVTASWGTDERQVIKLDGEPDMVYEALTRQQNIWIYEDRDIFGHTCTTSYYFANNKLKDVVCEIYIDNATNDKLFALTDAISLFFAKHLNNAQQTTKERVSTIEEESGKYDIIYRQIYLLDDDNYIRADCSWNGKNNQIVVIVSLKDRRHNSNLAEESANAILNAAGENHFTAAAVAAPAEIFFRFPWGVEPAEVESVEGKPFVYKSGVALLTTARNYQKYLGPIPYTISYDFSSNRLFTITSESSMRGVSRIFAELATEKLAENISLVLNNSQQKMSATTFVSNIPELPGKKWEYSGTWVNGDSIVTLNCTWTEFNELFILRFTSLDKFHPKNIEMMKESVKRVTGVSAW